MTPSLSICDQAVGYAQRASSMWGHPIQAPIFNVSNCADAVRYCEENFHQTNISFSPESLEIAMPEVFRFDVARHVVDWATRQTADAVAARIDSVPDAGVVAWMECRRLLRRWEAENGCGEDDMVRATTSLLRYLPDGSERDDALAMVEIWEDMSISVNLDRAVAPRL